MSIASNSIAVFLLWLFLSTGIHKLQPANRGYYATVFSNYGMSAPAIARLLPKLVGAVEIAIGVLVALPNTRVVGVVAAVTALLVYLLLMARQLWLGKKDMDCGCTGPLGDSKISDRLLFRNGVLIALALCCLLPGQGFGIQNVELIFAFALLLILLYLSVEQLISNDQKLERLTTR
ncbi:MAG: MauE/DoxX family redox-associated membrane protein [Pseudomonadales bacterium]